MIRRVGLYGGSFNPIHFGHLIVARAIREELGLDTVIFLPCRRPPHKDPALLAQAEHRAAMVRLAIEGEEGFVYDEFDLQHEPSYTIETVSHFRQEFPQAELFWFIGADSLMELPTWRRARELVAMCNIVTAARSGQSDIDPSILQNAFGPALSKKLLSQVLQTPVIDISSTDVRGRVADGKSIRFLVPEQVMHYMEEKGLYREPT